MITWIKKWLIKGEERGEKRSRFELKRRMNRGEDCGRRGKANLGISEDVGVRKMKKRELMKSRGGEEGSVRVLQEEERAGGGFCHAGGLHPHRKSSNLGHMSHKAF